MIDRPVGAMWVIPEGYIPGESTGPEPSDVPVVVQHTPLDSRQEANAMLTTIAYGC